jgi:hypothetical protein
VAPMLDRLRAMRRLPLLLVAVTGCFGGNAGDPKDDSFGGDGAKEDGTYSTCQLAEVTKLANESTSTVDFLKDHGLSDKAAENIVAHRNGPDGQPGTADDDIFDNLNELDAVDYVGNLALGKMVESILDRCEIDLDTRPFIDSTTFAGAGTGGWARDNVEVEVVLGVKGLTGQKLRALLLQKDSSGRTLYDRVRKAKIMGAFTYDYPLDEIPWDSDAMAARELMPNVSLTIEPGRYEVDMVSGERELSLGTDLMDDTYFDTPGYTLLAKQVELLARARWDSPELVRRILIAAKFGTEVDADGNKTNAKVDIRNDNGTSYVAALDNDVRRGKTSWNGSDQIATPIKGIYEQLDMQNALVDIGTHKKVLYLDPKVHLRSTRSRYHMNEARIESLRAIYANATTRITNTLALIDKAQAAGTIASGDAATVNALETKMRAVLDKTLLAQRINQANSSLGVTAANLVLPGAQSQPSTAADLDKNRIIAETINTVLHEVASDLDDADRMITGAKDEDFDDYADLFHDWRVSVDKAAFAAKTTWDSFVNSYTSLSATASRAASIAAFNTFIGSQAAPLDDAGWTKLGLHLNKMVLTVAEHQIETAGIIAHQLWFDQARMFWVPGSSRAFSNFMIDTFDMADMMSAHEWESIPEANRTFKEPLPANKIFNTVLVNELQVELGSEAAYVARLKDLEAKLAASPNDATLKAQHDGAKFVWGQYTEAMKVLTELKGERVLDKLKDAGATGISWSAPPDSKGNQALKILAGRDSE